jgi:hypothetical protein
MLYTRVKVTRDVNTVYSVAIPSWEIPVLHSIFDEGNVQPQDSFELVERDYPDVALEFDRLARRYGKNPENGIPYAVAVFGSGHTGLRALSELMDEARSIETEKQHAGTLPKISHPEVPRDLAEQDALLA